MDRFSPPAEAACLRKLLNWDTFLKMVTVSLRNATKRNAFPLIRQQHVWENQLIGTFSVGVEEHCLRKQITRISILQLFKWLWGELFNRDKVKI